MERRQQLGKAIAKLGLVEPRGGIWLVKSGRRRFTVWPDPEFPHCTCPDHEDRGGKCAHMFAVEYVIEQGSKNIRKARPTYPQNWPAYNAAQTNEKFEFLTLPYDLCHEIPEEPTQCRGLPRLSLSDIVFSVTYKVYSTFSGRRFTRDLTEAHERGYISELPHFNSIFNYLQNPAISPILRDLIVRSSLPLARVESIFAADSTGFEGTLYIPPDDLNYRDKQEHDWVKPHLMCGVNTHIITAAAILDRNASDARQLPVLLKATAEHHTIREVLADKVYNVVYNQKAIAEIGAVAYIPFQTSHTGRHGGVWERAYHYYMANQEEFYAHYHQRSNIEAAIRMIKSKFGKQVRSKSPVSMMNEVYCKVICHNICCLLQSIYELKIDRTRVTGMNV